MSIISVYNKVKEANKLYKLTIDGKIVGIRACIYDYETNKYTYYDFELSFIRNKEIQQFINSKRSLFQSLPLREYNGMMMSEQEISQGVVVQEFKDSSIAEQVLRRFLEIYK